MNYPRLGSSLAAISFALLVPCLALSHGAEAEEKTAHVEDEGAEAHPAAGHHDLVHPFMAHMGMPDGPGEVSLRVTSIQERNGPDAAGTYAFHIEAGVADRLGLHLRNDGVGKHESTEMMLQYAVLRSASGSDGLAVIGELEFPTGPAAENRSRGLFGLSFAVTPAPILKIDSVVHYGPEEKMIEWEIAFVSRLTKKIFPTLEFRGESSKDMSLTNSLLAFKFKVTPQNTIGVAYQIPITSMREYDSQLLMQAEFNFD